MEKAVTHMIMGCKPGMMSATSTASFAPWLYSIVPSQSHNGTLSIRYEEINPVDDVILTILLSIGAALFLAETGCHCRLSGKHRLVFGHLAAHRSQSRNSFALMAFFDLGATFSQIQVSKRG